MSYPHTSADCGEHHDLVRDFGGDHKPTITVLCGSTRFYDEFQRANYDLTMRGHIVLSVGFYPHAKAQHGHGEGVGHDSAEKVMLDDLHKRKIDVADRVYVLNVGGYIGESTRGEIEYAERIGRPVEYLEAVAPASDPVKVMVRFDGGRKSYTFEAPSTVNVGARVEVDGIFGATTGTVTAIGSDYDGPTQPIRRVLADSDQPEVPRV